MLQRIHQIKNGIKQRNRQTKNSDAATRDGGGNNKPTEVVFPVTFKEFATLQNISTKNNKRNRSYIVAAMTPVRANVSNIMLLNNDSD